MGCSIRLLLTVARALAEESKACQLVASKARATMTTPTGNRRGGACCRRTACCSTRRSGIGRPAATHAPYRPGSRPARARARTEDRQAGPRSPADRADRSCGPPSRRSKRSAPVGQRMTASATSPAGAASTSTHGRRFTSNTCGSARRQRAVWMQRAGSQYTAIWSVRYVRSTPGCFRSSGLLAGVGVGLGSIRMLCLQVGP